MNSKLISSPDFLLILTEINVSLVSYATAITLLASAAFVILVARTNLSFSSSLVVSVLVSVSAADISLVVIEIFSTSSFVT